MLFLCSASSYAHMCSPACFKLMEPEYQNSTVETSEDKAADMPGKGSDGKRRLGR